MWTSQTPRSATLKPVWTLTLYGKSLPAPVVLSQSSAPGYAAASADSSSIAYFTDVLQGPVDLPGTLMGASVSALDKPVALKKNVATSVENSDYPSLKFVGDGATAQLLAVFEAGNKTADFSDQVLMAPTADWKATSFKTDGGESATVLTDADASSFAFSTGKELYLQSSSGAQTPVTDASVNSQFPTDLLGPRGEFLLYISTAGGVSRVPVVGGASTVLVTAYGFSGLEALSDDEATALAVTYDTRTFTQSISLVPTGEAATPISFGASSEGVAGASFTADSKYAMALVHGHRDLGVLPTDGSSTTPVTLGTKVTREVAALSGSTVAFTENEVATGTKARADITVADVSRPSSKIVVAAGAATTYVVTADRTQIVYVIDDGSA